MDPNPTSIVPEHEEERSEILALLVACAAGTVLAGMAAAQRLRQGLGYLSKNWAKKSNTNKGREE